VLLYVIHVYDHVYDKVSTLVAKRLSEVSMAKAKKNQISDQLRGWRKRHKLAQSVAALELKVSVRTLQEWEQGRAAPRHLALVALRDKIGR
jgi:DNA-binding transcriptional regulator YiaG